jgi:hypothetical protein
MIGSNIHVMLYRIRVHDVPFKRFIHLLMYPRAIFHQHIFYFHCAGSKLSKWAHVPIDVLQRAHCTYGSPTD